MRPTQFSARPVDARLPAAAVPQNRRVETAALTKTRSRWRRLTQEPPRTTAQRVVRRLADRLDAGELDFPLLREDIADSQRHVAAPGVPVTEARPLVVGWVTTPPSRGSGGHTTMFRMIRALEEAGHRCVVLLYDRHGGHVEHARHVIRDAWPWVHAEVRSIRDGLRGLDACVATAWPTAHVLARHRGAGLHCFYFIQDYEPFFYPVGSEHALAADTYRFGFTQIALGDMVQQRLASEVGIASHLVPFSCDTSVYRLDGGAPRSGIVWYAKPGAARRGFQLVALALEEFHRRHPEHEIHIYGSEPPALPFRVTSHGRLSPAQLNELYNRVIAGCAMSFTNISLVAEEMLAAGCVPVVNDSPDAHADMPSPYVRWAAPTPGGIADALAVAVAHPAVPDAVAASVRTDNWEVAGRGVVEIVESVTYGRHG